MFPEYYGELERIREFFERDRERLEEKPNFPHFYCAHAAFMINRLLRLEVVTGMVEGYVGMDHACNRDPNAPNGPLFVDITKDQFDKNRYLPISIEPVSASDFKARPPSQNLITVSAMRKNAHFQSQVDKLVEIYLREETRTSAPWSVSPFSSGAQPWTPAARPLSSS